ncbi:MAG: cation-translocating P-type ATPase [Oscillospiraceae bacterium]|jgi:heavy metal translocating P-type ATPase|nr:cation-translocating P-type ATPase [Oscillospiraceae bacterium]
MINFFKDSSKRTLLLLGVSLVALVVSFFDVGGLPINAAWVAIVLCGFPIVKGAIHGLVTAFDIKADVLVSIALIASIIVGEIFAAGEVAFIMAIGAFLEERTVAKARAGIEKMVRLTPDIARVIRNGEEALIPASEVEVGDILRVLAGETVPADGTIIEGQTSVDQSIMTGEPLPVDKAAGDEVQSGTVNRFGVFDMRAEKVGEDSTLRRMIRLVESADAGKAKIVGMADRWATWIVVTALASAVVAWIITGEIIRSVTILVVFCPCALVLATPTAIMAGIGNATRRGVLISRGDALERMAKIKCVAFDKTGTLTFGQPTVTEVFSHDARMTEPELLQTIAGAELRSEHPLGKAIVAYYKEKTHGNPPEPEAFQLLAGRGVAARIDGREIFAGNAEWMRDSGVILPEAIINKATAARERGATIVFAAREKEAMGFVALSDVPRPNAADAVEGIHTLGVNTLLLTGDAAPAAEHIARAAGIADVKAHCLPEDKLTEIKRYQGLGKPVCMVGDGINDAPALKAANVGVAMGGVGSDIATQAADIVLVRDDIQEIPVLLTLSKKVMRTIRLNIAASLALNFAAIILAILGVLNPIVGALVHNAGSVAVIINSSLILGWKSARGR